MPGKSPFRIELSEDERRALSTVAARYSSPYRDVVRAKVVLYAAQGLSNEEIAARVDLPRQIVSKWRKRFFEQRLEGLKEAPRQGRPRVFPPLVVMAVKAVACELPRTLELPLSRLFVPDIQKEVIRQGIVASISGSTVWRWLDHDAIRPWTFRSWIFPPRPPLRGQGGCGGGPVCPPVRGQGLGRQ